MPQRDPDKRFIERIDSLIQTVLLRLDQLRHQTPETVDRVSVREEIRNSFAEFEMRVNALGEVRNPDERARRREEWELGSYAVVSWIDEMFIDAPWDPDLQHWNSDNRQWWSSVCLERECFESRIASDEFFIRAKSAAKIPGREALEVFCVAVLLGFRGCYKEGQLRVEGGRYPDLPQELQELPPTLDDWLQKVQQLLPPPQERTPPKSSPPENLGAPPLPEKLRLIPPSLVALILGTVVVALAWPILFPN